MIFVVYCLFSNVHYNFINFWAQIFLSRAPLAVLSTPGLLASCGTVYQSLYGTCRRYRTVKSSVVAGSWRHLSAAVGNECKSTTHELVTRSTRAGTKSFRFCTGVSINVFKLARRGKLQTKTLGLRPFRIFFIAKQSHGTRSTTGRLSRSQRIMRFVRHAFWFFFFNYP